MDETHPEKREGGKKEKNLAGAEVTFWHGFPSELANSPSPFSQKRKRKKAV